MNEIAASSGPKRIRARLIAPIAVVCILILLGYGFWSTGMSVFRNALYVPAADSGLPAQCFGLAALACSNVDEAAELARREGIIGAGNFLFSDSEGRSISVEYGADGVGIVEARDGIHTHANHAHDERLQERESYEEEEKQISLHRETRLAALLADERARLTAQKALMALADHDGYPYSLCRHLVHDKPGHETSAAIVAEPTLGRLHVVRGAPCMNWPVTYTLEEG